MTPDDEEAFAVGQGAVDVEHDRLPPLTPHSLVPLASLQPQASAPIAPHPVTGAAVCGRKQHRPGPAHDDVRPHPGSVKPATVD
jgi:hypothetical protein